MLYTIFDLETTGLNGTCDSIIQFAYITVNQNMLPVRGRNYYFYKEGMPWSEAAAEVHGLSQAFLRQYQSQYEENLLKLYTVLQRGNLIGHNSNSFDIPFASQFLVREGLAPLQPEFCYDTMQIWRQPFGKRMKLADLPSALEITEKQITDLAKIMFKETSGDLRSHNACFDVASTLCCLQKAIQKGLCSLQPSPVSNDKAVSALSL